MEAIIVAALGIVAQAAPGVLAAITGRASDAEAIEAARSAVSALHSVRVHELAEARRAQLEDRKTLASITKDPQLAAHLSPAQRVALNRVTAIAIPHEEP